MSFGDTARTVVPAVVVRLPALVDVAGADGAAGGAGAAGAAGGAGAAGAGAASGARSFVYVTTVAPGKSPMATTAVAPLCDSRLAVGLTVIGGASASPETGVCVIVTVELYSQPPSLVAGFATMVHDPAGTTAVVELPAGVGEEIVNSNGDPLGRPAAATSQIFSVPFGSVVLVKFTVVSPDPSTIACEPAGPGRVGAGTGDSTGAAALPAVTTAMAETDVPGMTPSETATGVPARQPVVPFGLVYGPGTIWHWPGRTDTVLVIVPSVGSLPTAVNVYAAVMPELGVTSLQIFKLTGSLKNVTIASWETSPAAGAGITVTPAAADPSEVVDGAPFRTVMLVTDAGVPGVSATLTAPAGTRIGKLQCPIGTDTASEKALWPVIVNDQLPVIAESAALLLQTSMYPVTIVFVKLTIVAVVGLGLAATETVAVPPARFDETRALPGSVVMLLTAYQLPETSVTVSVPAGAMNGALQELLATVIEADTPLTLNVKVGVPDSVLEYLQISMWPGSVDAAAIAGAVHTTIATRAIAELRNVRFIFSPHNYESPKKCPS